METFVQHLVDTLFSFGDPGRRLFWLFILSSAALAVLALWLNDHKLSWVRIQDVFFSKRYWFNPSTLIDVRYLLINAVVRALLATLFVGGQLAVTMAVALTLQRNFGTASPSSLPWWAIAALYTSVFFVLEDLSRFGLHRAMHKVPFLWRLHRVHHSATTLTPLTLHRVHPIETMLYYARGVMVFGMVSGVFIYWYGSRLSGLDILGVDLLGFIFNFLGANLRHSHIWLSFGLLERWLVSPAQHQIHHSSAAQHADQNFGTCLAVWDRFFGSWHPAGMAPQKLRFGIRAH